MAKRKLSEASPTGLTPAEASQILALRRKDDPCYQYKPIPSFQAVVASQAPNQCLECANQMGKSSLLQWSASCLARGIHPTRPSYGPTRGLVIVPKRSHAVDWGSRLTKRSSLAGALAHLGDKPYIPAWEIEHITPAHGSNMGAYPAKITLKNGSEIFFALSGDDRSWKTIEGWTFDWIIRDEFAGSENMGVTIGRGLLAVRSNTSKPLGGLYLWATTSTDPNEEWETFRDTARSGTDGYAYFTAHFTESNDYVSTVEREKWAAGLSEEQKAVRAFGTASAATSLFIYRRHLEEYEERLCQHLNYQPLPDDNLVVCYDPGWKDPCGILCGYITKAHPETVILTTFLHYRHGTRLDHVQSIREWADGRLITWFICDPNIQRTESNGVSYYVTFCEDLDAAKVKVQGNPIKGRNRNEDGIPLVEDYLLEKIPGQTLVFDMAGEGIPGLIDQLRTYRWKQLSDGTISKVTYVSKTQRDEGCLVAGTLVTTDDGDKPIESIAIGDRVLTRSGYRRVTAARQTSPHAPMLRVHFSDGSTLTGTPDHRVLVQDRGWIHLDLLRYTDTCWSCQTSSSSMERSTTNTRELALAISETTRGSYSTGTSGQQLTEKSLRDTSFITGMRTAEIMTSPISNACHDKNMLGTTRQKMALESWRKSDISLLPGINHPLAESLHESNSRRCGGSGSHWNIPANTAESLLSPDQTMDGPCSAVLTAEPQTGSNLAKTTLMPSVQNVELSTERTNTWRPLLALVHVVCVEDAGHGAVYDLTVDGEHEFFANGILVHNCDLLKYLCSRRPRFIDNGAQHRSNEPQEVAVVDHAKIAYEKAYDDFVGHGGTTDSLSIYTGTL